MTVESTVPIESCTVTVTFAGAASEKVTVAASACPSPSGLMLEGATLTALVAPCTSGVAVPSSPPVAGSARLPAASCASMLQLAATPGATGVPAAERPSHVHATDAPVPDLLAMVVPAASSTRTVHVSEDESVAEKRTGYEVRALASGAKILGSAEAYASWAIWGSCA